MDSKDNDDNDEDDEMKWIQTNKETCYKTLVSNWIDQNVHRKINKNQKKNNKMETANSLQNQNNNCEWKKSTMINPPWEKRKMRTLR